MAAMAAVILTVWTLVSAGQEIQASEQKQESSQAILERGAYAEEYEGDLKKAAALYASAEKQAREDGNESVAKNAADAIRRVELRIGGQQAAPGSQDDEAILNRIGELINTLSEVRDTSSESPDYAVYFSASSDLAVYGAAAVPWLEELLEPHAVGIGDWAVQLDTRMAARMLAKRNIRSTF